MCRLPKRHRASQGLGLGRFVCLVSARLCDASLCEPSHRPHFEATQSQTVADFLDFLSYLTKMKMATHCSPGASRVQWPRWTTPTSSGKTRSRPCVCEIGQPDDFFRWKFRPESQKRVGVGSGIRHGDDRARHKMGYRMNTSSTVDTESAREFDIG